MCSAPSDPFEIRQLREQLDHLRRQMDELGGRIDRLQRQSTAEQPTGPAVPPPTPLETHEAPLDAEIIPEEPRPETRMPPPVPTAPTSPESALGPPSRAKLLNSSETWEAMVGGRWMTWLGAFTLIVALAFFIPWAWKHFALPAPVRVLVLHLCGIAPLVIARVLHKRDLKVLAHGLAALGIFALYASAWAAQHLFGLWNQPITMLECSAITVGTILLAVRSNSVGIVLLGALGGYLTPIIASSGSGNHVGMFIFLAFLNVALVACAVIQSWTFLKPVALGATAMMFVMWLAGPHFDGTKVWSTEWLALLHFAIFLAGTTIPSAVLRRTATQRDLTALTGTSLWFVGTTWYLFHQSPDQQMALVCWGMSLLHFVLFGVTQARVTNVDRMPRVQLALAALFFTLAAPLQLGDDALNYLAITWAAQGLIFTAVGVYFFDRQMCGTGLLVLALSTIRLLAFDYTGGPQPIGASDVDLRLISFLMTSLSAIAAGSLYWVIGREVRRADEPIFWEPVGAVLLAAGNFIAMIGLTCQWHGRFVLLLWTIDAAAIWAAGFYFHKLPVRWYAAAVAIVLVGGRAMYHGEDLDGGYRLLANDRFATLALVAGLYFVAGWFYRRRADEPAGRRPQADGAALDEKMLDPLFGILANVVLVVALSLEIKSWYDTAQLAGRATFPDMPMARLATYSIVWAVYAAAMVAFGFVIRYPLFRMLGLIAFLPILVKVFFIDLASLNLMPRVLALAVLGFMLLSVSFLYQKFVLRIEPD